MEVVSGSGAGAGSGVLSAALTVRVVVASMYSVTHSISVTHSVSVTRSRLAWWWPWRPWPLIWATAAPAMRAVARAAEVFILCD